MPRQTKKAKCGVLSEYECQNCVDRENNNCPFLPCGESFLKFIRLFKKKDGWYYKFYEFNLNTMHYLGDVPKDEAKLKAIQTELGFWGSMSEELKNFVHAMEQWKFDRNIKDD